MLDYGGLPAPSMCYIYRSVLTVTQQILTSGTLKFKGYFSHKAEVVQFIKTWCWPSI